MSDRGRVLLVGRPQKLNVDLQKVLEKRGFTLERCPSLLAAWERVADGDFDAILCDFDVGDGTVVELCDHLRGEGITVPALAITDHPTLDTSVAALRAGAYDYLSWPTPIETLAQSLDRAVDHHRLTREVRRLRRKLSVARRYDAIIGESPPMKEVFDTLERVATSRAAVLVTGETGTGKELVARAIHESSRRAQGPFVAVNCAAIPEGLIESELFGHVRGAFTDARTSRKGLFVQAEGGTLFLDEVGDLPLTMQVKLLRALQDRAVRPVGAETEVPFDARIVAATNRDLEQMVEDERFRRDLYYRLNVIHVDLPPLRSRSGDVLLLANYFLERAVENSDKEIDGFTPEAARRLLEYRWPGNIRELENCVERAVAFTQAEQIGVDDLPGRVRLFQPTHVLVAASDPEELAPLRTVEERYLRRVMQVVGGNKAAAARILGIERKTLYRKLQRLGIESSATTDPGTPAA